MPSSKKGAPSPSNTQQIEKSLSEIIPQQTTSFERIQIARHPKRPKTVDYIEAITEEFLELTGDRNFKDDRAVVGGLATIDGVRCVLVGQEKGRSTEERLACNFGMVQPEGFRKAQRLAYVAEKFSLPLVFLIDTTGAYPGVEAEERGQGWAIASNLRELFRIKTPIIVVIIGEGCSGGALAMGVGDTIGMLEHAYFSVITPEGCASILWRDAKRADTASQALKLHAEDLFALEIIDEILKEGPGGAHLNPRLAFDQVKAFIAKNFKLLSSFTSAQLLDRRFSKFRKIGSAMTLQQDTLSPVSL